MCQNFGNAKMKISFTNKNFRSVVHEIIVNKIAGISLLNILEQAKRNFIDHKKILQLRLWHSLKKN